MTLVIGGRGLAVSSAGGGGGGLPANPYEAIAGLNSLFAPDLCPIVYDDIRPACTAIGHRSAIETVPLLMQPDISSAPPLGAFNGPTKGFVFDGTSTQHLRCWSPEADCIGGAFTLFALLKTTAVGALRGIYAKGLAIGRWRFGTQDGGFLALNLVEDGTATEHTIFSDAVITDGEPRRVICIYDPAQSPDPTMTMVVNGVLQAQTSTFAGTLQTNAAEPVTLGAIGASNGTASFGFTGIVRDVGTYNVPLRGADVAALDRILAGRV